MRIEKKVKVGDPQGLHLRAAAHLTRLLQGFHSHVLVRKAGPYLNARSVLCLLQLGAAFGVELCFLFDGEDARQALEVVQSFLEKGQA